MDHGLAPAIHLAGSGQELPGAGGDRLLVRLVTAGACPMTLLEDTSRAACRTQRSLGRHAS